MSEHRRELDRRAFLQYFFVLGTGIGVGSVYFGDFAPDHAAVAASPDATATRQAELKELHTLQTEVAEPLVCTPAPTATEVAATATATVVPLSQTGIPLPYDNIWTVTVLGIALAPIANETRADGKFLQVNLVMVHNERDPQRPRLTNFVLVDDSGRLSIPDLTVNQATFGDTWSFAVRTGKQVNQSIIFDVAADAGDSFILESNADPTFRVGMTVEQRG